MITWGNFRGLWKIMVEIPSLNMGNPLGPRKFFLLTWGNSESPWEIIAQNHPLNMGKVK
jgi:hypothetical protein